MTALSKLSAESFLGIAVRSYEQTINTETWLQLTMPHVEEATNYLKSNGVETCDEIEELPERMHGIMDPSGTVFNIQ